ncbi:hypothetical protein SAMN06272735_3798 [Streptomyces sp. TLI_55]|uniref:hypothetical protein n=1 Tax=Streptomyces sp. TLI_55 TaxID=1938861 RepID=UPI000BD4CC66|nr:hypothetical protein [Streptomyces sp. TLI_55]SNX62047.1 hypothetical protein SAMN06272735_3798 [Streptomyces sp. TLI_55]
MRIRATVAAVSAVTGALALTGLAVPAAQAADSGTPYTLDVSFSNFKIASSVKVGTGAVSTKVSYTLTHGSDVDPTASDFFTDAILYRGSLDGSDDTSDGFSGDFATCTVTSATTANCTGTIDIEPADNNLPNADAGTWKAAAEAIDFNGQDPNSNNLDFNKIGYKDQGDLGTTKLLRLAKLTANASPEPVKKGRTITVTGKLTRANWETLKYAGYSGQSVKLQFRKKGSSTYTTVKTIKSSSTGALSTTVTASADGYYRYSFAGTATTSSVNATGDYIDVQ